MGDRPPGIIGTEPPPPDDLTQGLLLPGTGIDVPGPVGLDAGTGARSPAALRMAGWPRNLTWNDFPEIESSPNPDENAQIHSEITQPDQVTVQRDHGQVRISGLTVTISVLRDDSWVVRGRATPELLSHEQGHYDITGLMGRDMGNEMLSARAGSTDQLQAQITQIIQRYRTRATELNERYDTETNHGRNRDAQQRWDERIRSSMQSGTRFTPP